MPVEKFEENEETTPVRITAKVEDSEAQKQRVEENFTKKLLESKVRYYDCVAELFFLENGGNMMDFLSWKKKRTPLYLSYLKQHELVEHDEDICVSSNTIPVDSAPKPIIIPQSLVKETKPSSPSLSQDVTSPSIPSSTPVTPLVPNVETPTRAIPIPSTPAAAPSGISSRSLAFRTPGPNPVGRPASVLTPEQIVEKAKQEAFVMQRISELQREGLWSEKRLPKVQEPARPKCHWDYLLEEMVWLAADFAQERKWKKAAARKCARMVQKHFQEKAAAALKAEREEELRLKKIANLMAKEIKNFWNNAEKFLEYKQNTLLEEKRKQALDQTLNFIVFETEKYSSWLAEGIGGNAKQPTQAVQAPQEPEDRLSDGEFEPASSSSDDEETIAKAEEEEDQDGKSGSKKSELDALLRESDLPLEDLLNELPPGYLDAIEGKPSQKQEQQELEVEDDGASDEEFQADSDDEPDDEATLEEEEAKGSDQDHQAELAELEEEGNLPLEKLMEKYRQKGGDELVEEMRGSSGGETDSDDDESMVAEEEEDEDEEEEEEEDESSAKEDSKDMGLASLFDDSASSGNPEAASSNLNDVAALAETFQPKGNTLASAQVHTKVPFLLKLPLREYQHVGLEWLATLYERKLNGILADEMGLGKTIQTIALLAWLACEKGIWGPHLVVVPTSVMLNWEMEFKKWCPGFKILTYYGSQKDRKLKRTGWTKPNAFHVCITSYKLVIQDHQAFRRKRWKYFILDEAQNIKNFKSQRWQLLLNFQSQRRLLLTGTPLQNNLMELWSLMHFLMPDVFESHRDFREWFSNPVTGMIEGSSDYNESVIRRLHKVLRPFLLRRLKSEVEKQLPQKYEHVVMCRLSKRQRYLYDDFMSRAKTRETLSSGNLLSVINVLMQLRKVCNHPNLFEARPTISPFQMQGLVCTTASCVFGALDYDPFKQVNLYTLNLLLAELELTLTAFAAHRVRRFQAAPPLIQEVDWSASPPPRCPAGKIRLHVRASSNVPLMPGAAPINASAGIKPGLSTTVPSTPPNTSQLQAHLGPSPAAGVTGLSAPQQPRLASPAPSLPGSSPQPTAAAIFQSAPAMGSLRGAAPGNNGVSQSSLNPGMLRGSAPGNNGIAGTSSSPATNGTVTGIRLASNVTSAGSMTSLTVQLPQGGTTRLTLPTSIAQLVQPGGGNLVASLGGSGARSQGAQLSLTSVMTSAGQRFVLTRNPAAVRSTGTPSTPGTAITLRGTPPSTPLTRLAAAQRPGDTPATPMPIAKPENGPEPTETLRRRDRHAWDKSVFRLPNLEDKRRKERREKLALLARLNKQRCAACPIYGADLIEAVAYGTKTPAAQADPEQWQGSGAGYVHCLKALEPFRRADVYLTSSDALRHALLTPEERMEQLRDTISRFVFCVPPVNAPAIQFHVSHPQPSLFWQHQCRETALKQELFPKCSLLHPVASAMVTQFPDPRLIQYDCGKLQTLSVLLRQLKVGKHRVLLFTQMTRMLDVLESFLAHEGHLYLRLDGTTKVDQRQALMERFNADTRIFAFILSTRSGGVGVNLTGADTVVFYDSDWNPTMDAQAQDRCHRIGQTRDVHIYRLISERTVEENILKKANQKRLLGDIAIEGGNFTTAQLKNSTIQDLFDVDQEEADASKRMAEVLDRPRASTSAMPQQQPKPEEPTNNVAANPSREDKGALGVFETALASVEDESDVVAARTARAEAAAELAEFDESAPVAQADDELGPDLSKAEAGLQQLEHQLTPVERYAIRFMEICEDSWSAEQLKQAQAQIEDQKKAWELKRLAQLNASEHNAEEDEPGNMIHYSRFDANQDWVWDNETMPVWCPPTPPQGENDVYVDHCLSYLYESTPMEESRLPPVTARRELKRPHPETLATVKGEEGRRPLKIRKEESFYAPRSLFDRPSPALMKMRRDMKLQKGRGVVLSTIPGGQAPGTVATGAFKAQPYGLARSSGGEESENVPDWLIQEDMVLLQTVQNILELPASLVVLTPAHTPNWDLVSDMVNGVSRTYRSPKQCRNRYLNVILPREEGKLVYEPSPKKAKKNKHPYRPSQLPKGRPLRTAQLYATDNNASFTSLYLQRFQTIKSISIKKAPTSRSVLSSAVACSLPSRASSMSGASTPSSLASNSGAKQAMLLSEAGIQYDTPLSPLQVAVARAERVAREKQKTATAALAAELAQQAPKPNVSANVSPAPSSSTPPTPRLSSPSSAASPLATALANQNTTGQSVLVSVTQTHAPSSLAAVVSLPANVLQASGSGSTIRAQRPVTTLALQSTGGVGLLTVASSSGTFTTNTVNLSTGQNLSQGTVVSVSNLTAAQMQAAAHVLASAGLTTQIITTTSTPRVTAITAVQTLAGATIATTSTATTGATSKTFTPAQLQLLKQQALLRQQQQRLSIGAGNVVQESTKKPTTLGGSPVFLAATSGSSPTKTAMALGTGTLVTATQGRALANLATSKAGGTTLARTLVSEADMAALLRRQVQAQGGTSTLVKTVTGSHTGSTVTLPVSGVGLQQVKGLVSGTASALGVKTTPATQQQLRQLALQQQLLQQRQKMAQQQKIALAQGKANMMTVAGQSLGMGTVQLVQPVNVTPVSAGTAAGTSLTGTTQGIGGPKGATLSTTVTMQQLQQVIRQVTGGGAQGQTQLVQQAVLAKPGAGGHTVQARVIPINQQSLKQTIQDTPVVVKVVSAGQGTGPRMAVSNASVNAAGAVGAQDNATSGRTVPLSVPVPVSVAMGTNIASALAAGTLKVAAGTTAQQQALLSQVSAALQSGQPVSLAVRTGPVGGSPARLIAQAASNSNANQPPPAPEDPPA